MSTAHLLGVPEDSPLAAPEGWGAVATNAVCAVALFACTCVILYVLFIYPLTSRRSDGGCPAGFFQVIDRFCRPLWSKVKSVYLLPRRLT